MGKAQRRRATRKSHHESATSRPATNDRVLEATEPPAAPPHKPDLNPGAGASKLLGSVAVLRTIGIPRIIGFIMVSAYFFTRAIFDIFCERAWAQILKVDDPVAVESIMFPPMPPFARRPRYETNTARETRWAYWRLYYSKRGNEAALKRLGKLERRACDICGRQADVDEPRCAVCDGCGDRRYCGTLCQRADWILNKHSEQCSGASR